MEAFKIQLCPQIPSLCFFTRFKNEYNIEPADLFIINLEINVIKTLVSKGSCNVNLPCSVWNSAVKKIVFSSSRVAHEEIYIINEDCAMGTEVKITERAVTNKHMNHLFLLSDNGLFTALMIVRLYLNSIMVILIIQII